MNTHFSGLLEGRSSLQLFVVHQQAGQWTSDSSLGWLGVKKQNTPASRDQGVDTGLVLNKCRWSFHQHLKTSQEDLTPHSTAPTYTSMHPTCLLLSSSFVSCEVPFDGYPFVHSPQKYSRRSYYMSDVVLGTVGTVMKKKHMAPALTEFSF